ncbi:Anaerobic dehydrogenases, typically selenocysteine-containing [Rubrivivax sp. A210]|uniref:molybdopterin-containing oxidoreductase family protein n=1 Tax=Rubrivivax sp. A210 TaxID=2772301 RepID=UPI001918463C|nr:molybdopterin-dependent oxidoreductase [Rubrivivax sp. A210]CAD5373910.1 Anaerobic dehydrogenases, typically selenocysteine-containing [Rubrivivax sp. A210]
MVQPSRRRFLQITAATLGATAASAPWQPMTGPASAAAGPAATSGGVTTIPTFCEMCFWRCGGIAHLRDGKLWKFEGNPLDPQSMGRLCPRGTGAVGAYYDPDRLRQPLLRVGERGKEQWKAVSWDEALGFVAERMGRIKAAHGAESVALFNHVFGQRFFQHVLRSWGVINYAGASYAQCRGARDVGFQLTFGAGVGSPEPTDIKNTDCLVLIGSHLGENMHNSQVQEFAQAIARQVPIIVVDPRYSVAASKAKYWLPVKPGTDIALLLAWMNLLVTEGLYDKDFVARHGHGFEQFKAEIAGYTTAWAAEQTGVAAELIVAAGREFASHRPASIIHPGRRVNWYGDDSQRSRAVALLNALLGNWGRKGGLFLASGMKIAPYPLPKIADTGKPRADGGDGARYPFADEGITTSIRDATISGQPYPIKGWVVYSTNLLQALPNRQETLDAIQKLDLLVVCDTVPSEIAGYADVILPDTTFLERHDELLVGFGRTGWTSLRQPVVAPPHEQKPAWWIAKQLAEKLGIGASMPFKDMEEYLAWRIEKSGHSWDKFKREGVIMGEHQPITVEEGLTLSFDTPSGKVEFWSDQLAAKGFDPVPKYKPQAAAPAGHLRLITGRAPVHTFSRTQSNPLLQDLMPENEVWVNTATAARLGLTHRAYVRLKNQDGVVSNRVRVKATQRIREDCVYMVYGFGNTNPMLASAYLKGASAGALNTRYATDPLMGSTSIHGNFVSFVQEA